MKVLIFLSIALSFLTANADVVIGDILYTCNVNYEKADGPFTGEHYEITKEDTTGQLKLTSTVVCPSCIVVPTIDNITKDELVDTIQTFETEEVVIEIYLESLVPTKTFPASVVYKEDGSMKTATCEQF